jgi:hypothetical protein
VEIVENTLRPVQRQALGGVFLLKMGLFRGENCVFSTILDRNYFFKNTKYRVFNMEKFNIAVIM